MPMRKVMGKGPLSVRAIAGSHVVVLAWDIEAASWEKFKKRWLGMAIQRIEHTSDKDATIVERYWLRGMKRFEFVDQGSAAGAQFSLAEHPVQGFQWGDYTAKPGHTYTYRLVPVRGKPKFLELSDDEAVEIRITTEPEDDEKHGIWFNRGVAASQAYARRFGEQKPNADDPASTQMTWLSRGLFEALVAFIKQALAQDATYKLVGALYEVRYAPVLAAIKDVVDAGVEVSILFDEPNYGEDNLKFISDAGLTQNFVARRGNKSQKHNKFLVLLRDDAPVAVWTGSTNISAGGIFGHSNVGHSVRDATIAAQFLNYWKLLAADPDAENDTIRLKIVNGWPTPEAKRPDQGMSVMFSPRTGKTLDWYAGLMNTAQHVACFTVAFTVADAFAVLLEEDTNVLRYILQDKASESALMLDEEVLVAVGAKLDEGDFPGWLGEHLTGFNRNLWVHNKFLLVDPLGDDPVVATGSANFSRASMSSNDENMLLVRGDKRVADIYFGEFMRVFDHIYARHMIKRALEQHQIEKNFLKDTERWVDAYRNDSVKAKRRSYFRGDDQPEN